MLDLTQKIEGKKKDLEIKLPTRNGDVHIARINLTESNVRELYELLIDKLDIRSQTELSKAWEDGVKRVLIIKVYLSHLLTNDSKAYNIVSKDLTNAQLDSLMSYLFTEIKDFLKK